MDGSHRPWCSTGAQSWGYCDCFHSSSFQFEIITSSVLQDLANIDLTLIGSVNSTNFILSVTIFLRLQFFAVLPYLPL